MTQAPKACGHNMIDPARLAFDIDGVVADTMTLFLDIADKKYGYGGITQDQITSYMIEDCLPIESSVVLAIINELLEMSHEQPLNPVDGAVEVLSGMAGLGAKLTFVTARPRRRAITQWLSQAIQVPEDKLAVHATGSFEAKAQVLTEMGVIHFVEDRLETCFHLAEHGIDPILFARPWNRKPHPFIEINNWEELKACIAGL
ncbi:MAG: haloacid dehalogenase [Desulfatibacillaceae bacterium]|nr:haloacid dehalogenase [Desulfatibacillaceae bacterium]